MAEQNETADITTWNELPKELKETILSRLPVKPIFRLRSVSKEWKSLLTSKPFLRQWASESPLNPCLMLWTPFTQTPCFIYSFGMQSWETLSLSSLFQEKCRIVYQGSTLGLLLVDIPSLAVLEEKFVCNPLSGTFRKLPDIPHEVRTVVAHGIACDDGGEGYKVIIVGKNRQNTVELYLYESAARSWRHIPAAWPGALDKEMVYCAGKFFCLAVRPPGMVVLDVHGAGNCTVVPLPNGCNRWSRLVTCGGSVLLASARMEEERVYKDVIMWQYCCPTWREVARMSGCLGRSLIWAAWFNCLECVGVGDNVCFKTFGSIKVLVYNTSRGSWTWLPTCRGMKREDKYRFSRGLPFQLSPDVEV